MSIEEKKAQAKEQAQKAEGHAKDVAHSDVFRWLVTSGLVTVGVVHILIGVLALQLAWSGGSGQETDQKGALGTIAENPIGRGVMWVIAVALFGLFVWKLTQAWWGYTWKDGFSRTRKRLGALGGGLMYLFLGITAMRLALGSGAGNTDQDQQTRVGELLSKPFGQVLAGVVAAAIIGYAGILVKRGVTSSFTQEYEGEPSPAVKRLGQVGYIAKGIAIGLVGVLFGWAALTYDPEKAGGLDDALRTVKEQGAGGPVLLTIIALGLMAYGVYCFSWSRNARR